MTQMMQDILNLSVSERLLMVEKIWDSIEKDAENVVLSPELIQLLDRRLKEHNSAKVEGSSWEEVKNRINKQL